MRAEGAQRLILQKVNQEPKEPCVARIVKLIHLLQRVETLRKQLYEHRLGNPLSGLRYYDAATDSMRDRDASAAALTLEFQTLLAEVSKLLRRYHWTPTVQAVMDAYSLEQSYIWARKKDGHEPAVDAVLGSYSDSDNHDWENRAVLCLMGSVKGAGRMDAPIMRFRQCQQCATWLYTLTDHQVFCGENCRKKAFSKDSPEFKRKRREYMANRRAREKKKSERELKKARQLKGI